MKHRFMSALVAIALVAGAGAAIAYDAAGEKNALAAIAEFKNADPSIETFFNNSYGYAIFPEIAKGAVGIGGASGDGTVFQGGQAIGSSSMSQVTIGLALGGQTYREAIFFKDQAALDNFKQGNYEFAAEASAVAVKTGAAKTANYDHGVAIFTMAKGGLMFEASIGGQKFSFEPR
ncbi:MAG TPA: lipid-binding SYLF domain-containing protein [Dongiaceae bacterium]